MSVGEALQQEACWFCCHWWVVIKWDEWFHILFYFIGIIQGQVACWWQGTHWWALITVNSCARHTNTAMNLLAASSSLCVQQFLVCVFSLLWCSKWNSLWYAGLPKTLVVLYPGSGSWSQKNCLRAFFPALACAGGLHRRRSMKLSLWNLAVSSKYYSWRVQHKLNWITTKTIVYNCNCSACIYMYQFWA